MSRLLAAAAILVAGAAIFLVTRDGGSSHAGTKAAAGAAGDRGKHHSDRSRPRGGDPDPALGRVEPPAGSTKPPPAPRPRRHKPAVPKPLTRKQFIRQADAICEDAHEQVGRIGRRLLKIGIAAAKGKVPSDSYYRRSAALTVASQRIAERAIDDLEALPGPSDRRIDEYLAISADEAGLLGDQAEALRQHDGDTVQTINLRLVKLSRRSRKLAESYGFHACGGAAG